MPSKFITYLEDDWSVSCSPSGYTDQICFFAYARHFVAQTKPHKDNVLFLFIDGHDSHWSPEALSYLRDNYVYPMFLKSNNSINDQPSDMGPNAKWKSCYGDAYQEFRVQYPTVPMTPDWQNRVLVNAWYKFKNDKNLASTITKAWAKSNLFPMVDPLKEDTKRLAMLAATQTSDTTDFNLLKRIYTAGKSEA